MCSVQADSGQRLIRENGPRTVPRETAVPCQLKPVETVVSHEKRERSTEDDADRFLDSVNRSGFWQSIDLRLCAIRSGRRWVNLVTRGFLDHRTARVVPGFSPVNRPDFRAWQVVLPIADLPGVVHGITSGTVKLRPCSVGYVGRASQPATDMTYVFSELAASYQSAEYDLWSCHVLVGYGSSMWDVVRQAGHDPLELDSIIRSGPNAYDGLSDLVRRFCVRPRGLEVRGNTTVIELIAPLAVRFDREKATSSPERVTVALSAASDVFVAKAGLGWTLGATGQPPRHGSVELREYEWVREGGALHVELDIPVQKGDSTATSFIVIGDRCVDCVSVPLAEAGGNIRIKAHNAIDPGLKRFREQLQPVRSDRSTEFEAAVGLLFFFLGFHVNPLSVQRGLGDAVDHLAHAPGSSVILVVECTVGSIDTGGKVGKLIARSADFSKLPDSEVIAVLATARPRAALSKSEVEKAERDDVVLLAREDLHDLWTGAQAGETSAHVVRRLRQLLIQGRCRRAKGSVE